MCCGTVPTKDDKSHTEKKLIWWDNLSVDEKNKASLSHLGYGWSGTIITLRELEIIWKEEHVLDRFRSLMNGIIRQ